MLFTASKMRIGDVGNRLEPIHLLDCCKSQLVHAVKGCGRPMKLVTYLLLLCGPMQQVWKRDTLPEPKRRRVFP